MRGSQVKKRANFLASVRENGGNVSAACTLSGIPRRTVYDWRNTDPGFANDWEDVIEAAVEDLEQEVRRRALLGVEEPVYYQGKQCGTIRRYSDTLLMFRLKALRPEKYRERVRTEVSSPNFQPPFPPLRPEVAAALSAGYKAIVDEVRTR